MVDITFDKDRCIQCGQCVKLCSVGHLRMTEDGPMANGRGPCIGCLQCAAVCPRQAVLAGGESAVIPTPEDALEKLIVTRRSVRKFKEDVPDRSLIQWALDRAAYAPSGKNRHANRWTVVYGHERMDAVKERALQYCAESGYAPELPKFAAKGLDLLTCGAPALIYGWAPDDCLNPCVDTVIAMETAELLLVGRGLGTCWGGYMRRITNNCPDLRKMLGIPGGCSVQCCMVVGYPQTVFLNAPVRPAADIYWC